MALTYATWVSSLANLLPVQASDPGFIAVLPNIRDDAELRLYRALDLLDATVAATTSFTAGVRSLSLPVVAGTFIVTQELNVITPAGATPQTGTRNQLVPASMEMLNALWPSAVGSTVPQYFAMFNQDSVIVGPWPNTTYTVEATGTIRPAQLSSSNVTTVLSVFFPDLFIAASMVFAAGYQKNFGAAVDDPKAAVTWEAHYQSLLADAKTEENRKMFVSQGWSANTPVPSSTSPRT